MSYSKFLSKQTVFRICTFRQKGTKADTGVIQFQKYIFRTFFFAPLDLWVYKICPQYGRLSFVKTVFTDKCSTFYSLLLDLTTCEQIVKDGNAIFKILNAFLDSLIRSNGGTLTVYDSVKDHFQSYSFCKLKHFKSLLHPYV